MRRSRRYRESLAKVDRNKEYNVEEGIKLVKELSNSKFDESFEISINLGVDPKHADQIVRGTVSLPHGTGKERKVLVLVKGTKQKEAKEAGADYVGFEEYINKIKEGWTDVDVIIATPDVMGDVGKLGRILGPRGLMPNPKSGTVTDNVEKAVREVKSGRIDFRVDRYGIIHSSMGKVSFEAEKILENFREFLRVILRLKPSTAKGQYLKKITFSSTMGPGVKIERQSVLNLLK
ncbi:MAG: 50S ribosomal protein L1 [Fidelibacterota bacterium]